MAIVHRHGLGVHSYADDSQLHFHADISVADDKDKTQFVWLGTPHQLSRIRCQKITFGGADIKISTEAMCLGVLLDSRLTFAPHIRRISCRCFYHLRQLRVVRKSLTVEAAKTMVHSFVVARYDYCNSSVYYGASAVHIRPLQNVLNAAARLVVRNGKYDSTTTDLRNVLHWLPVQQRTEYKVSLLR